VTGVLQPRNNLRSHYDPEEHQKHAAPGRPQRHPAPQPPKGAPAFLDWRRGKIIEGFGKLAAALRKENTGSIEFIGGLQSAGHRFLKMVLLGEQGVHASHFATCASICLRSFSLTSSQA